MSVAQRQPATRLMRPFADEALLPGIRHIRVQAADAISEQRVHVAVDNAMTVRLRDLS